MTFRGRRILGRDSAAASLAGLNAKLRSGKSVTLIDVLVVTFNSVLLGMVIAFLWYLRHNGAEHPWFTLAVSLLAGIGGVSLLDRGASHPGLGHTEDFRRVTDSSGAK